MKGSESSENNDAIGIYEHDSESRGERSVSRHLHDRAEDSKNALNELALWDSIAIPDVSDDVLETSLGIFERALENLRVTQEQHGLLSIGRVRDVDGIGPDDEDEAVAFLQIVKANLKNLSLLQLSALMDYLNGFPLKLGRTFYGLTYRLEGRDKDEDCVQSDRFMDEAEKLRSAMAWRLLDSDMRPHSDEEAQIFSSLCSRAGASGFQPDINRKPCDDIYIQSIARLLIDALPFEGAEIRQKNEEIMRREGLFEG